MTVTITWTGPEGDGEWTGSVPVVIGREGDLEISDPQLSRRHAELSEASGVLTLTDLNSANGTFVGDARIESESLDSSGRFRLGHVSFIAAPLAPEAASVETVRVDPNATVRIAAQPVVAARPHIVVAWRNVENGATGEARVRPPAAIGSRDDAEIQLEDGRVSRRHATVHLQAGAGDFAIVVQDEGSSNGTYRSGETERIDRVDLGASGEIEIRPYVLRLSLEGVAAEPDGGSERAQPVVADEVAPPSLTPPPESSPEQTVPPSLRSPAPEARASGDEGDPREETSFDEEASIVFDEEPLIIARDFPPPLFDAPTVSVDAITRDGRPILEADYVAVGGGLGSFVWVDMLRIGGVARGQIAVLGLEEKPHSRYERLCIQSQIPDHERLRSDSGSCPDCIWGWPGYAVREAWKETFKGDLTTAGRAVWKIFNEPTFATTYTPRSGDVFASIDVEAERIGWDEMRYPARVRAIRKTDDGRYAIAYTVPTNDPNRERYALARYVHVAVGYPGIRLLPDLQTYRQETGDTKRVVNAYEEHEQVYQKLARDGGTVVLRGWGIVASRIIQTLWELRRDKKVKINVLHLTRSIVARGNSYRGARRETANNWEFQPFNWPKACWGGDLRFLLEESGTAERAELLKAWGGTTTADREDWRDMVVQGLDEGWYQIREGVVDHVEPTADGKVRTVVVGQKTIRDEAQLDADFILDCTGLVSTIDSHPLLRDLVEHHGLGRNVQGRLDVAPDFEIRGMRNTASGARGERSGGRMYAAGVATLGGPYAPVDSFLGLQYSAQRSIDALERLRAPRLRHLNSTRSFGQWVRWARGQSPDGRRSPSTPSPRRARPRQHA
ncbi:FHA domain-containing protein [Rubricoccus marinus]|uniref:FHA domain-containing protein n=1 Tax=Rubricoccus marinus TaxID=716817 RepID=A0A259TY76_9BACT|nr:FHA domain-containing protein [Rubricoccus marinus]OZC02723.1 hypothetical protein BSZ36_06895 [Rubricoccus marinus]